MTIEEALEIIENTNFYTHFTNEKQEEAFSMATGALMLFQDHKKDIKVLEKIKGDYVAHLTAKMFRDEISVLEWSGDNGEQ